jgi:hypothetical protein
VTETIAVHVPRREVGNELTAALGERGLHAELIDDGELCAVRVSFADEEYERLVTAVTHAVETWLSDQRLPLVVQQSDDGCVLRPPSD